MIRFLALLCVLMTSAPVLADTPIFTSKLKAVAGDGAGGEGPAWHPELGVLTSGNGHIQQLDHKGQSRIYRKDAGTNGLLFDRQGRLLACEPVLRRVTRTEADGKITVLSDRYQGKRYNQPNDLTIDSQNRIYFTDPRYGSRDGSVDPASKKTLYDWGEGRGPDGLKQDQQGRLYVAGGLNKPNPPFEPAEDKKGGIYVFSPEGKLLAFLPVPTDEVTNCAFGGDDLKTLYITGGGVLYSVRTAAPGRVVWPTKP